MAAREDVLCGTCNKKINLTGNKGLECKGNCEKSFHIKCVNIDEKTYVKFAKENGKIWNCPNCKKRKRSTETSPLQNADKKNKNYKSPSNMSSDDESENGVTINENESVAVQLQQIADMLHFQGQQHTKQLKSLKAVFNEKMETVQTQITENSDDIIDLRNENAELKKQMRAMQSDVNVIQQQKLSSTIEIAGVVESKDENLKQIVMPIAKAADVNINVADVVNVYRKKNGKILYKTDNR